MQAHTKKGMFQNGQPWEGQLETCLFPIFIRREKRKQIRTNVQEGLRGTAAASAAS